MSAARRTVKPSLPPAGNLLAQFTKEAEVALASAASLENTAAAADPVAPADPSPSKQMQAPSQPSAASNASSVEQRQTLKAEHSSKSRNMSDGPSPANPRGQGRVQVQVYIDVDLRKKVAEFRQQHRRFTQAGVVMYAINQVGQQLIERYQLPQNSPEAVNFFAPPIQHVHRRDGCERGQMPLSMTTANRDQLDELVERFGFASRSDLVETSLELFFNPN